MCLFFEDDKITLSESKRGIFMLAEKNIRVVVRGAGDLASGVIAKLYRSGFEVAALECEKPSSIRRTVSFSEAVYQKEVTVEGITAKLADEENAEDILAEGNVPVLVDPEGEWIESWKPQIVVDAILAKKIWVPGWTWRKLQSGWGRASRLVWMSMRSSRQNVGTAWGGSIIMGQRYPTPEFRVKLPVMQKSGSSMHLWRELLEAARP